MGNKATIKKNHYIDFNQAYDMFHSSYITEHINYSELMNSLVKICSNEFWPKTQLNPVMVKLSISTDHIEDPNLCFINNIKISGIKLEYIDNIYLEIGNQIICDFKKDTIEILNKEVNNIEYDKFKLDDFTYLNLPDDIIKICLKFLNIYDETELLLPIKIIPIPKYHLMYIIVTVKPNSIPVLNLSLQYDILRTNNYKFDTDNNKVKLLINQPQYMKRWYNPVDTICVKFLGNNNIPEDFEIILPNNDNNYHLKLNHCYKYTLNDYHVYKFDRFINFSNVNCGHSVNIKFNAIVIDIFCISSQLMQIKDGMVRLNHGW